MNSLNTALDYLQHGLCTLPARLLEKRPDLLGWKEFQKRRPAEEEIRKWFATERPLCIVCGSTSGCLEMADFDNRGELFEGWKALVQEKAPGLFEKLVVEQSQSGGFHVAYRCEVAIPGNLKLAMRDIPTLDEKPVEINGKTYVPRKVNDRWIVTMSLIETRGEGGLFLCTPSPGYVLVQGSYASLPVLTAAERDVIIETARSLNEVTSMSDDAAHLPKKGVPLAGFREPPAIETTGGRPGDAFNERGDVREILLKHGWTLVKSGENEAWRRPGKKDGHSATLKDRVFYVHTSNAPPFEMSKAYAPFSVYAMLEHGGDFAAAASSLRAQGYDSSETPPQTPKDDAPSAQVLTPKQLLEYDTSNDPNTLLGNRWLCRSGSCLVVGQTGLGKSSFCVQAAVTWALGLPLFGIAPIRPLRSLIIQAENDIGDLAEMFTGVIRGTGCEDRLEEIDSQIAFVTEASRAGECFHAFAFGLIERFKPDLVWIDPLFAFLGGNVSDQKTVSPFLRNGLGAIAQATGITWMVVHHTNKPPKEPGMHDGLKSGDFSYLGAGSAELANWARAVLVLRETEGSVFELRASKRGRRAGLLDAQGQPATEVFLKHGQRGICWERAAGPEEQRQDAEAARAEEVVETMEVGRAYDRFELRDIVGKELGVGKSAVLTPGRRANRIFRFVMAMTHDPERPGSYAFAGVHKRSQERV